MITETITMYRPCGPKEMILLEENDFKAWPSRLTEQPIFYPVTNEKYAIEINQWNVRQFGIGYITEFDVIKTFVDRYEVKTVGAKHHTEWWVPAEDLDELNDNIVGNIRIIGKQEH